MGVEIPLWHRGMLHRRPREVAQETGGNVALQLSLATCESVGTLHRSAPSCAGGEEGDAALERPEV